MLGASMEGRLLVWAFFFLLWISAVVSGENVLVHVLRHTQSESCSLPKRLDVTVLRHQNDDVIRLSMKTNDVITLPTHVVLMSTGAESQDIQYQHVQVPEEPQAYHSVDHGASFVIRCSRDQHTNTPFYILEGTFFHENSKFKLHPTNDDVIVGPIDVTASYVMNKVQEFNHPQDHQFLEILDSNLPTAGGAQDTPSGNPEHHRNKRQTTTYFIDVLPVLDFYLYSRWLSQNNNDVASTTLAITTYMTNVFTSMSIRIRTLNLENGVVLNLRMMTPHLCKTASASPFSELHKQPGDVSGTFRINVETQLKAFKEWLVDTTSLPDRDHTMLFTGYDVYGGLDGEVGNNLTRGLAYVGGICQRDGFSCSVVQDQMAYQSEPVAVHELGHSLGSKHDGDGNACDSLDQYIMANGTYDKTASILLNQFAFSTCSSQQIAAKIDELAATEALTTCLKSKAGSQLTSVAPLRAKDQCQALFGQNSYVCRGSNFRAIDEVCTAMYCAVPGGEYCRSLMAATGTCCGNGKYCIEGVCTASPTGECVMDETCPFEDQPGIVVAGKTCAQIENYLCYQEQIYERCCRTCEAHKTEIAGCAFGDKSADCTSEHCGRTLTNGIKYNFYCCQTCNNVGCQDSAGLIFQGSKYTCPAFVDTHGKNYCYFQVIHDSYCCLSCENHRTSDDNCPYGDFLHLYNCPAIAGLGRACTDEEKTKCCETCKTITAPDSTATTAAAPAGGGDSTPVDTNGGGNVEGTTTEGCTGWLCGDSGRASSLVVSKISFIGCLFLFFIRSVL